MSRIFQIWPPWEAEAEVSTLRCTKPAAMVDEGCGGWICMDLYGALLEISQDRLQGPNYIRHNTPTKLHPSSQGSLGSAWLRERSSQVLSSTQRQY